MPRARHAGRSIESVPEARTAMRRRFGVLVAFESMSVPRGMVVVMRMCASWMREGSSAGLVREYVVRVNVWGRGIVRGGREV